MELMTLLKLQFMIKRSKEAVSLQNQTRSGKSETSVIDVNEVEYDADPMRF